MERDFYPEGEQAPGVQGEFKEWIPAPEVKSNVPKPVQTEAEAVLEAMRDMGDAVPYTRKVKE